MSLEYIILYLNIINIIRNISNIRKKKDLEKYLKLIFNFKNRCFIVYNKINFFFQF